jgi:nucleoid DNA-binding protein
MIPKKANKLYKQVAEELNVEENLVEDFIEFLYKEVRGCLSDLKHPRINVEGLGHFAAKPNWIRRSIERSTKILENHDTSTFGAYSKKVRVEEKLNLLIKLEEKISVEENRKKEFKISKYEQTNSDMEGKKEDN